MLPRNSARWVHGFRVPPIQIHLSFHGRVGSKQEVLVHESEYQGKDGEGVVQDGQAWITGGFRETRWDYTNRRRKSAAAPPGVSWCSLSSVTADNAQHLKTMTGNKRFNLSHFPPVIHDWCSSLLITAADVAKISLAGYGGD